MLQEDSVARRSADGGRPRIPGEDEPLLDYFHTEEETEPGRIGPYELVARFPSNEAIEVFLAHKFSSFGFLRTAVVKRSRRKDVSYAENRQALLDEARAIATLDHANLVSLIDANEEEAGTYLAVEFVDGTDLARVNSKLRARGEALPFELACFVTIEVLRGLHHAHSATSPEGKPLDLVHRDVHPTNVLIARTGHVKLTDFGGAVMRERLQESTQPGVMKGRLAYKSPEYLESGPVDRRMDVYSVGMILFELLTGRPCFSAATSYELIEKILSRNLRLERLEKEGVPPELVEIVARAGHGEVGERFASAEDLANALETWIIRKGLSVSPWILSAFFRQHNLFEEPITPRQAPLEAAWKHSEPPRDEARTERPTAPPTPAAEPELEEGAEEDDGPYEQPTYPGVPRPLPSTDLDLPSRDEPTSPSIPVAIPSFRSPGLTAPRRPPSEAPPHRSAPAGRLESNRPAPQPRSPPPFGSDGRSELDRASAPLRPPQLGSRGDPDRPASTRPVPFEPLTVPESSPRPEQNRTPEAKPWNESKEDPWPQGRPTIRSASLRTGDLVLPPAPSSKPPQKRPETRAETERPDAPARPDILRNSDALAPFPRDAVPAIAEERPRKPFNPAAPTERIRSTETSDRSARVADLSAQTDPSLPAPRNDPLSERRTPPPEVSDLLGPPTRAPHQMPPPVKGPLVAAEVFAMERAGPIHAPEAPASLLQGLKAPDTQPEHPPEPTDLPALPDVPAVPRDAFQPVPEATRFPVDAMAGELAKSTPREILEKLVRLGATGRATFTIGPIWKALTLRAGKPLTISSNMGMEILGEQLVQSKLLTRGELDRALRESSGGDDGLVARLLKLGLVERGALARQLGEILTLRLSDMLDWSDGSFEFAPLLPPEPPLRPDVDMLTMLQSARPSLAPKPKRRPSEEPPASPGAASSKPSLKRVLDMAKKVNEAGRARPDDLGGSRKKP